MVDYSLVAERVQDAKAIAFDNCHKIYLLMDDTQVAVMNDYGYDPLITNAEATPEQMLELLKEWFEGSCGLRFIQAVTTYPKNPNLGFENLIAQGEYDLDGEDFEDDTE